VPPERLTVFVNRAHISGILLAEQEGLQPVEPAMRQEPARYPAKTGTLGMPTPGDDAPRQSGRLRRFSNQEPTW
jgi:hypothetical protein